VIFVLYLAPMLITNPKYGQVSILRRHEPLVPDSVPRRGVNRRLDALIELLEADKKKDKNDA